MFCFRLRWRHAATQTASRELCAVAMQRCYCLYRRGWLAFAPTIGLQIWSFWPFVKTVAPSLSLQCNVTMKFKMADQTRLKWRQFGRFCAWNVHKMTNYTSLRPSYIPRIQQRQIKLGPHVLRGYSKLFTAVRHRTTFCSNFRNNFPSSPLVSSISCFLWHTAYCFDLSQVHLVKISNCEIELLTRNRKFPPRRWLIINPRSSDSLHSTEAWAIFFESTDFEVPTLKILTLFSVYWWCYARLKICSKMANLASGTTLKPKLTCAQKMPC